MLRVDGLRVQYGPVVGVEGLDLAVERGEIVALLGANGSGKSSVLNAIAGLVPVRAGNISIDGKLVSKQHAAERVSGGLALVVEGRGVFSDMTVRENLELGAYAKRALRQSAARKTAIERVLELFPRLGERLGQLAGSLSGGEQQMLVIGRALMSAPSLLLLDEPSLGLAPRVVDEISKTLRRLSEQGEMAILVAEQNAALGLDLASRGYVLRNGRLALAGERGALRAENDLVRLYLGGAPA